MAPDRGAAICRGALLALAAIALVALLPSDSPRRFSPKAHLAPARPHVSTASGRAAGNSGAGWKIRALGIELPVPPNFRLETEPRDASWPFELRGPFIDWPSASPASGTCVISLRGPFLGTAVSEHRLLGPDERLVNRGRIAGVAWTEALAPDRALIRRYVVPVRSNAVVLSCEAPAERAAVMRVVCDEFASSVRGIDSHPAR
ncbi:MAG: hypothetical protein ACOX6T_21540 [Myxococcales bacterium]|jgi:hypothetical protein